MKVKYKDYLGIQQEGIVVFTMESGDVHCPYFLIQDLIPEHNTESYNGIPYADVRLSEDCELMEDD